MADDRPLRVVLFGYGLGGRCFHAPYLTAEPGLRLTAVVTSSPERAAQARADHGAEVIGDADEVWERAGEFDLAVISTGNAAHVPLADGALQHGLHAVVDKPLCGDLTTGRWLAGRAQSADRLLVAYQNRRWDGDFRTLLQLRDSGALGTVHRLESRFERWRPVPKGGWRESAEPEDLGGLLYDLGSHLLDQALVLLGSAVSVYAEVGVRRNGESVDDDTFVAVTHSGGAVSHHWMSVLTAEPGPRLRALGSLGTYRIHRLDPQEALAIADPLGVPAVGSNTPWGERDAENQGVLVTGDGARAVPTLPGDYRVFWTGMVAAVRGIAAPPVPIEQTLALLEVIDAARESGRTGQVVEIGG